MPTISAATEQIMRTFKRNKHDAYTHKASVQDDKKYEENNNMCSLYDNHGRGDCEEIPTPTTTTDNNTNDNDNEKTNSSVRENFMTEKKSFLF